MGDQGHMDAEWLQCNAAWRGVGMRGFVIAGGPLPKGDVCNIDDCCSDLPAGRGMRWPEWQSHRGRSAEITSVRACVK